MIQYSIEIGISWLLFYSIYYFFLKQETFFKFNRAYLIGTIFLGLIIPKIGDLELAHYAEKSGSIFPSIVEPITVTAQKISYSLETIVVTAESATSFNIWKLIFMIWAVGSLLACARFLYGIFKISNLLYHSKVEIQDGYKIAHTGSSHLPFSFLNIIFWSDHYLKNDDEKKRILEHELVHIRKSHSLDNILIALLQIPFWWVLPLYGYKIALKTVHEYEADDFVTLHTSVSEYGRLLMQYANDGFHLPMTNSFAFTHLKNRIIMMTQEKSNPKKLWKYLAVIPVALVLTIFLANTNAILEIPNTSPQFVNDSSTNNFNEIILSVLEREGANTEIDVVKKKVEILIGKNPGQEEAIRKSAFNTFQKYSLNKSNDPFDRDEIKKELTKLYALNLKDKTSNFQQYNNRVEELKKMHPTKSTEIESISLEIFNANTLLNNKDGHNLERLEMKDGCIIVKNQIHVESLGARDEVFKVVQTMPHFSNCINDSENNELDCSQQEMLNFIYTNINYPKRARTDGIEGVVVCRFIVDKTGKVVDPEIVRSIGGGCDEEVLRLVNTMPDWQPGIQSGKIVNVYYNLPVKFKLQEDNKEEQKKAMEISTPARIDGCEDISDKDERFSCTQKLLLTEIYTNINYPKLARENGIEGVSILSFDVSSTGMLMNPRFKKYIGGNCEEAILTMFEHLQKNTKWIPAELIDGSPVKSEFVIPIKFKLQSDALPQKKVIPLAMTQYDLFPNPTDNEFKLRFQPKTSQALKLAIYDSAGKRIISKDLGLVEHSSPYSFDTSNWLSGMYIIKIIGKEEVFIDQVQVIK